MPRFFFQLKSSISVEDITGRELPDVAAAREEAMRFAHARLADAHPSSDVIVTDESGDEILTVTFPAHSMPQPRHSLRTKHASLNGAGSL